MKRVAIIGGGISGLTAAYELECARRQGAAVDWQLYEASDRLGGIVETTRLETAEGEYVLEGGPDGWVSEKPWARELAVELGLEEELIFSNDATRKTYILRDGEDARPELLPIPDGMRLMVPTELAALEGSPLFTASARAAYADELARAEELKTSALDREGDESVASFVRRHFGEEVTRTLAAPLLAGVFGGDVETLSVRAVMPQFVAMEREHGSLIAALRKRSGKGSAQPIFTSLRRGMATMVEALVAALPAERIHCGVNIGSIERRSGDRDSWQVVMQSGGSLSVSVLLENDANFYDEVLLATPLDATRDLLRKAVPELECEKLLPDEASSAVLVSLVWSTGIAGKFAIPQGFGFLVLPAEDSGDEPGLLACTFVDQKFPHRVPRGARVLRAFFGGAAADALADVPDEQVAAAAMEQLRKIFGVVPEAGHAVVRCWPRSLPQYAVGHHECIARLETLLEGTPGLHLLGNSYHGVGLPDLIRDARATVRNIVAALV